MSRRKVLDRERKAKEKKKAENKRRIPNGILIVLVVCLALGGLIYMEEDPLIGIAVFLSAGVLIVPNAILMIRKDGKKKKYNRKVYDLIKQDHLEKITDDTPFRKKIMWGVIREGFLNVFAFLIMYIVFLVGSYIKGNYAFLSRDRGAGMFYFFIAAFLFIPLLAYSGGFTVARLIWAVRRDYILCRGVITRVNDSNEHMYIKGNKKVYEFDYCRGIGVDPKTLAGKEAVIVFCHDEIYVMECEK